MNSARPPLPRPAAQLARARLPLATTHSQSWARACRGQPQRRSHAARLRNLLCVQIFTRYLSTFFGGNFCSPLNNLSENRTHLQLISAREIHSMLPQRYVLDCKKNLKLVKFLDQLIQQFLSCKENLFLVLLYAYYLKGKEDKPFRSVVPKNKNKLAILNFITQS